MKKRPKNLKTYTITIWRPNGEKETLASFVTTKAKAWEVAETLMAQGFAGEPVAELELNDGYLDAYFDRTRNPA